MILYYFKLAYRNILKYKTQNIISIIGLAVGLLCFSICFYCSRFVGSVDTCYQNYNRLAELNIYNNTNELFSGTSATLAEDLRKKSIDEIEAITSITYPRERPYNICVTDRKSLPYTLITIEVDSLYVKILTPTIILGNWNLAAQSPNSIILTESVVQKVFGKQINPIGKQMILTNRLSTSPNTTPKEGGIPYTIQAVIKDLPINTSLNFMENIDILVINDSEGLFNSDARKYMTGVYTYALLRPEKQVSDLNSKLNALDYKIELFNEPKKVEASIIGDNFRKNSFSKYLSLITGIVGILILLSGLLNFFHFQIGSFLNRTKEFNIQKVIGSNSKQLFYTLFIQTLMILATAFILMFGTIELINPWLKVSFFRFNLVIPSSELILHSCQYILLILILCFIICVITIYRIRRKFKQSGIYGTRKRYGKQWLRNSMLGIQFFICWIFIVFTSALYLQSNKTSNALFGTLTQDEKASILSVPFDYSFMSNSDKLNMINRIRQYSGIKEIMLSDIAYTKGVSGTSISTDKNDPNASVEVNIMSVPENFFSFMHIPLIQGKTIETQHQIVVDEIFAGKQKEDIMNKTLYNYNSTFTVSGICMKFLADTYNQSPGFIFMPIDTTLYIGHCYIKTHPNKIEETKDWIKKLQIEILPESIEPQVTTLLEDIWEEQALENKLKNIICFFSIVSILITLLGVYSSITLDTERKQKEIAIRKINGASIRQIILLFARLYITLLVITAAIAFPLCYAIITLWKQMYTVFFNYGILFWVSIFMTITLITACTILYRIYKISHINPAEIIKNE